MKTPKKKCQLIISWKHLYHQKIFFLMLLKLAFLEIQPLQYYQYCATDVLICPCLSNHIFLMFLPIKIVWNSSLNWVHSSFWKSKERKREKKEEKKEKSKRVKIQQYIYIIDRWKGRQTDAKTYRVDSNLKLEPKFEITCSTSIQVCDILRHPVNFCWL